MKNQKFLNTTAVTVVFLAAAIGLVTAQTNDVTNVVTTTLTGPVSASSSQYWDVIIALLTPFIVTGIHKLVPKIPKFLLPAITPVIGVLIGVGLNWLTSVNLSWLDMAKAGALAVFVREVVNQAVTKQLVNSAAVKPAPVKTPEETSV